MKLGYLHCIVYLSIIIRSVSELQEVDWMNDSMKRLLHILPCIYLNQYDSFMQVIKDEEESTEVVFMKLFVLIHLRQFDPIPTLLQQYPSIQNQAGILSLYQSLQHLQSVQKDTAYTDIIKPLEECLNLPVSSNLLTLLMDRLVFEEACISLGSFYQSYYQDDEKAILFLFILSLLCIAIIRNSLPLIKHIVKQLNILFHVVIVFMIILFLFPSISFSFFSYF